MTSLETVQRGLQESLRLVGKVEELEEDLYQFKVDVKGLTKEAAREVKEELQSDFRTWVKAWDRGFQREMPNIERELKQQISGYFKER